LLETKIARKMRKLILLIIMALPVFAGAQTNEPNDLVTSAFTSQEIADMSDQQVELLNFQATSGFIVSDGKMGIENCISAGELLNKVSGTPISLNDLENLNIHLFDFEQLQSTHTNYCFEDGTVIMIYSTQRLETLLNRHKINSQN
jgi:hypothetical protein